MSEFEDEIGAIFAARNERDRLKKEESDKAQRERDAAREVFIKFRDTVVSPVFDDVKAILEGQGVTARIEKDEDARRPGIRIKMFRKGDNEWGGNIIPALAVHWDGGDAVHFHRSSGSPTGGSMSGGDGSMRMQDVTAEGIKTRLLRIIRDSFS